GELLKSLCRQSTPLNWEVLVVDNGSTDSTKAVAAGFGDRLPLRIVDAADRSGAAHARNRGAHHALGDWIVFCDADDVPGDGWLNAMARALSDHPVVIPRFEGQRLNPESPFRPLGQQDGVDSLWYPPFLHHAGGSGIGVWRECHERVGGFDESLRVCEDTDYTVRLQLAGYPVRFASDATLHIRFPSAGGSFLQARQWARANTLIYKRYGQDGEDRGKPDEAHAPWRWYLAGVWRIVRRIPRLRKERVRAFILWQSGWHLGLLEGAVRNRVPPVSHPPRSEDRERDAPARQ
ncbi:MAG: glycosyltransferase family 2 protein, partial [Gemmatimonadota bacterium]|nr:glycosyltransferase family 2 protein [Gemmatimonadota bacterium]